MLADYQQPAIAEAQEWSLPCHGEKRGKIDKMKEPNIAVAICLLLFAALLEVSGDALVRTGLHVMSPARRAFWMTAGAAVLFFYGWVVNTPNWNFGRLLGVYIAVFFVVSQVIAWLRFGERPTLSIWVGGALIVLGGGIITLWTRPTP